MKVFTPPYRKITSNKELEVMSTPKVGHLPSEKNQMSKSDVFLKPSCFCSGTQEKPAPIFVMKKLTHHLRRLTTTWGWRAESNADFGPFFEHHVGQCSGF